MSHPQNTALAERIEGRIDQSVMGQLSIDGTRARAPTFATMRDVLEFAKVMAVSGIAIRAHLRNNPGACAAVCMQAQRWEMDPYTVANKSYAVNDQLAYEAQLIAAVVNTRAPIRGRLKTRFVGDGLSRKCIAWATFIGEDEPTEVSSPSIGSITPKNSPLWKGDPDQQLAYYTMRLWARRSCPEVLLGVYDIDELASSSRGPDAARDITPPRPTRADFVEGEATVHGEIADARIDGGEDGAQPDAGAASDEPDLSAYAIELPRGKDGRPNFLEWRNTLLALLSDAMSEDEIEKTVAANLDVFDEMEAVDAKGLAALREKIGEARRRVAGAAEAAA